LYYVFCGVYPLPSTGQLGEGGDPRVEMMRACCARRGGNLEGVSFPGDSDGFIAVADLPSDRSAQEIRQSVCADNGEIRQLAGSDQRLEIVRLAHWMGFEPGWKGEAA
jgi:hypothetical protein